MKLKNFFLGLLASAAVLASCQPQEEQLGAPALNLDPETMEFESAAGEQTLTMTATRDWAVTNDQDWLVFDPASGSGSNKPQEVKVTVLANPESDRTYEAAFSIGMITKTLTVSQKGDKGEAELEITPIGDFIKAADGAKVCILKGRISGVKQKNSEGKGFFGFDITDETGTVTAAFPANWDEYKDQLKNGQIVTLKGTYQFYDQKKTHQVKDAVIMKIEDGGELPPVEKISIADFISKADGSTIYELCGTISNVKQKNAEGKGFFGFDINDGTATVTAAFPANWDEYKDKLKDGQKVTLQGAYQFYDQKKTHQVKDAVITKIEEGEVVPPTPAEKKTIKEFLDLKDTSKDYQLEGTVSKFNSQYCSFDLTDATGTVVVWSVKNKSEWSNKIKNGGTVVLNGRYKYFEHESDPSKSKPEVVDATILSFKEEGGSNPDQPVGDAIFTETFAASLGDFKVVDVTKPAELANGVWQYSEKFKCVVATGYTGGEGGSRLTTESSIVSPEIDLASVKEAYLEFEQAGNYFKDGKAAMSLFVIKDGKETALAMDNSSLSGFTWKKFDIDLTPYVGGKVQIKLTYKSTPENCGTWEIKNFNVFKGKYVAPELPDEPAVPAGTKVVLKTNATDMNFAAETDATYGKGFSATKDGVKIGYYQHKSTSPSVEAKSDHIRLYKSSAFVISIDNAKIKYVKFVTLGGKYAVAYATKDGKVEVYGDNVIWTGETASPFVGEMTTGQIRVQEITIVY